MLSKSLIQFSIDGPGCVQPYLAEIDHSRVSGHSGENPSWLALELDTRISQCQFMLLISLLTFKTFSLFVFLLFLSLDSFSKCLLLISVFLKESASVKLIAYFLSLHMPSHRNFTYSHILKYYFNQIIYLYLLFKLWIISFPFSTDCLISLHEYTQETWVQSLG